jgi:hypothetical protein
MSCLSSVLRESHIACCVATAMRHYIRRDAFRTYRNKVDNNQLATCTYCLRQTGSIVIGAVNERKKCILSTGQTGAVKEEEECCEKQ